MPLSRDAVLTGATTNVAAPVSQIWKNTGHGTFSSLNVPLPGLEGGGISLADYDNDGLIDIALTGYDGSNSVTQIWRSFRAGSPSHFAATPSLHSH